MNQAIRKKLQQQKGESIAETLIALLISSLALLMLAGAVTTATRLILKSKDFMRKYYDQNNQMLEEGGDGLTLILSEKNLIGTDPPIKKEYTVSYRENQKIAKYPVVSYTITTTTTTLSDTGGG